MLQIILNGKSQAALVKAQKQRLWPIYVVLATSLLSLQPLGAQRTPEQLQAALLAQPLYLRGLWIANKLEFDGAGHLRSASEQGPLTMSGVDVTSVLPQGKDLLIHARRAALVANEEGRLERQSIYSTTHLEGSLRRGANKNYIAYREITLLVHPDASGGFDAALQAIFANGLAELASVAPPHWSCYAQGYFLQSVGIVEARKTVAACVQAHSLSIADPHRGDARTTFLPARILSTVEARFTSVAAELGVQGVSHVRFTVSKHGVPVGFQIMRAVGGGMDEETLRTVSKYRFQPATRDGSPVPADLDVNIVYSVAP